MQQKPMIIARPHSIIITPQVLELIVAYTRFFIHVTRKKLDEYLRELDHYREHVMDGRNPDIDEHILTMQWELQRAESVLPDLERLQTELVRIYDRNFEMIAAALRRVRLDLKLDDFYTDYDLRITVETFAHILKEGNASFDHQRFYTAINKN